MGTPRVDRTSDDVEALLASYKLPGGGSWLKLVKRNAAEVGARLCDACKPGRSTPTGTRAKHASWAELRALGYSWNEIAAPWGADHTTVMDGARKANARAAKEAA